VVPATFAILVLLIIVCVLLLSSFRDLKHTVQSWCPFMNRADKEIQDMPPGRSQWFEGVFRSLLLNLEELLRFPLLPSALPKDSYRGTKLVPEATKSQRCHQDLRIRCPRFNVSTSTQTMLETCILGVFLPQKSSHDQISNHQTKTARHKHNVVLCPSVLSTTGRLDTYKPQRL
jgi:hypothetical protein